MINRSQQVIPLGNGWAVKKEGSKRFTVITETKKDAVAVARQIAKTNKSNLVIFGKDGKIQDKNSYANESRLPK